LDLKVQPELWELLVRKVSKVLLVLLEQLEFKVQQEVLDLKANKVLLV
jgi:hypothetical protein